MRPAKWKLQFGQWLFQRRSIMPAFLAIAFLPVLDSFQFVQNCHARQVYWELGCLAISLSGLFVRCMTVAFIREGSSGRELSTPQAERLNTSGLYSVVRNPLYLGNMMIWVGLISMLHQWWLSGLILLVSYLYHSVIIIAEESYLAKRFGKTYLDWRRRTPAFIPNFRTWIPPEESFSAAMVMRREYSGLFQIIAAFSLMNLILHHAVTGDWVLDSVFQTLMVESSLVCGLIWGAVRWTVWLAPPKNDAETTGGNILVETQQKKH